MKPILCICSLILILTFSSCKTTHISQNQVVTTSSSLSEPLVIVYKTTKDYSNLVPVIMNDDRTKILSYPDPIDLISDGKLTIPTTLSQGYLLDNRGINENVVFLSYTYEAYSRLTEVPTMAELILSIVDKYPLSALIYCAPRSECQNDTNKLNTLIDNGFIGCKKMIYTAR